MRRRVVWLGGNDVSEATTASVLRSYADVGDQIPPERV